MPTVYTPESASRTESPHCRRRGGVLLCPGARAQSHFLRTRRAQHRCTPAQGADGRADGEPMTTHTDTAEKPPVFGAPSGTARDCRHRPPLTVTDSGPLRPASPAAPLLYLPSSAAPACELTENLTVT